MGWNITDAPSPADWPVSSILSNPPACEQDYYVILWYLSRIAYGIYAKPKTDPALGTGKAFYIPIQRETATNPLPHDSRANLIIGVNAAIAAVLTIIVGLRLCLRYFKTKLIWGLDDWLMIPAYLAVMAMVIKAIVLTRIGGVGKHTYDVTYKEFTTYWNVSFIGNFLFYFAAALIKLSLAASLYRLVHNRSKGWRSFAQGVLIIISIWTVLISFMPWWYRGDARWVTDIVWSGRQIAAGRQPERGTIALEKYNIGMSAIHVGLDFVLLISAAVIFLRLKIGTGKKLQSIVLFSAGFASCLCSTLRLIANHTHGDIFYSSTWRVAIWAIADLATALVVVNLPILGALLPQHRQGSQASSTIPRSPVENNIGRHHSTKSKSYDSTSVSDLEFDFYGRAQR